MRELPDFIGNWVIAPDWFEQWANVLSENDNVSDSDDVMHQYESVPVGLLSFY